MAEICGVLHVTLLLYLIWIPSGLSQQDLESSPASHECGFKGMPQNAKLGDLFILNCRVTVNGLWNASLVFRNSYDGSEIRGEVFKCGRQPSVGSRICSTVRVNVNANILAYICNLEFPADQREEPKNAMFQKSKWTTRFNREVVCYLPKVYLETIPADVSFLCNHMPCEEIVEVNDNIRCIGYEYPQPDFDLRGTMDNSTEKESLRRMFAHVEKIHVYAENGGTIRTVKSVPGPEDGRVVNDDESDEKRAQLMEEVTALTQQFMEEYGPNMEEVKLKELYNSIVENYTFPDLEYKSQVFMDSDNGGAEEGNSASPDGTAEAFSDGDEPSLTQVSDEGISEQGMTTEWNSDDRYGDTTKEEVDTAIPHSTREAVSDGDEPSFTHVSDEGIREQGMTTEWNSGASDSDTVSEYDEDDEMTTQAPESAENELNGFKDYQAQQTDVGHIEVSCNVSNALGWGYIVMSLQVLSSTQETEPGTIDPIQPDTTMSAVTVDKATDEPGKETDEPGKETSEPDKETSEPDKATSEPDKEPDEYTRKYTEESELPLMSKTEMEYSEVTDGYLTSPRYSVWEGDGTQKISEPMEDARRGTYSGSVGEDLETTLEGVILLILFIIWTVKSTNHMENTSFRKYPCGNSICPTVKEMRHSSVHFINKSSNAISVATRGNFLSRLLLWIAFILCSIAVLAGAVDEHSVTESRDTIFLLGDKAELDCFTNTSRPPRWYFKAYGSNDIEFIVANNKKHPNISDNYSIVLKDNGHVVLLMDHVHPALAGTYECLDVDEEYKLFVEVIVVDSTPFCYEIASRALENIFCRFMYYGNFKPEVEWLTLKNSTFSASCKIVNSTVECAFQNPCTSGSLSEKSAVVRPNCSEFNCTYHWDKELEESSSTLGVLRVKGHNTTLGGWICHPTELSSPLNRAAVKGEEVRLNCSGYNDDTRYWFRNAPLSADEILIYHKNILRNDWFSVDDSVPRRVDLLFKASKNTSGRYGCNSVDSIHTADVIVTDPQPSCSSETKTGAINVSCSIGFSGNWPPVINWYDPHGALESNNTVTILNHEVSSCMVVRQIDNPKDLYTVTCSVEFRVQDKPSETTATNIPEVFRNTCGVTIEAQDHGNAAGAIGLDQSEGKGPDAGNKAPPKWNDGMAAEESDDGKSKSNSGNGQGSFVLLQLLIAFIAAYVGLGQF